MRTYRTSYVPLALLTMLLLCMLPASVSAKLSEEQAFELADQARQSFQKANELAATQPGQAKDLYRRSILQYQSIIEQGGIANAYLYYNIGNAYLMQQDWGRAILNYRRAEQLAEHDPDLAKNLDYARSRRLTKIPVQAQKRVMETLFFWHYDFTLRTRFWVAVLAWALAVGLGGCALLLRRAGPVLGRCAVVALFVVLLCGGSVVAETVQQQRHAEGVIVAEQVIARQGDGQNYPESFNEPLSSGTEFTVIERRISWWRIELPNGQQTWIPAASAELI